jgi:hypothetical protein
MKVKDLISLLSQENQEGEVLFSMDVGCCGDSEILTFAEVDQILEDQTFIRFRCPEFLNSCRKYGHSLELSQEAQASLERGLEQARNGQISELNFEDWYGDIEEVEVEYSLVAYDSEDKVLWNTPIPEKVFNAIKESENDFDEYGDCFPIDREDYLTLQEEFGIVLPFNSWQIAEKTSILLDKLLDCRKPLIDQRNKLVDKPFFLFRKSLKEKVALLDKELDEIDAELNKQRRIYASSGVQWYLERHKGDKQ